jgi:hypothetical protein
VAWNRQQVTAPASGEPATGEGAFDWSVAAMRETTDRLLRAKGWDRPPAFAVITEAVWWVTMVDATLVRYHPGAYGAALARHDAAERTVIENTFGGLRFVRNRMGYEADHDDFIQPGPAARLAAWTWKPVAEPALSALPPRGQDWEMTRYLAYQSQLARRTIGETFERAAAFLRRADSSSVTRD